jgi:ferredoxin/rubrerythrin
VANVTFSSPVMAKDVTVYAVAGDRGTVLAVAKSHKIPIPFDCQDGECGSCLVEVKHLNEDRRPSGISLTEKEKELLRQLGKITKKEIEDAEVNDMPPRHRLACQCFVRNEDILVAFEGDKTLPAKSVSVTRAAKIYKGGLQIKSVEEFHNFAVKLEQDAALHYDKLAAEMAKVGNAEVAKLFEQLAKFSRLHLAEAEARAAKYHVETEIPSDYAWPDYETPEHTDLWAGDPALSRLDALRAALVGEKRGHDFYFAIAGSTQDDEIEAAAKEFYHEEAEHVRVLEAWITREDWLQRHPLG